MKKKYDSEDVFLAENNYTEDIITGEEFSDEEAFDEKNRDFKQNYIKIWPSVEITSLDKRYLFLI